MSDLRPMLLVKLIRLQMENKTRRSVNAATGSPDRNPATFPQVTRLFPVTAGGCAQPWELEAGLSHSQLLPASVRGLPPSCGNCPDTRVKQHSEMAVTMDPELRLLG